MRKERTTCGAHDTWTSVKVVRTSLILFPLSYLSLFLLFPPFLPLSFCSELAVLLEHMNDYRTGIEFNDEL